MRARPCAFSLSRLWSTMSHHPTHFGAPACSRCVARAAGLLALHPRPRHAVAGETRPPRRTRRRMMERLRPCAGVAEAAGVRLSREDLVALKGKLPLSTAAELPAGFRPPVISPDPAEYEAQCEEKRQRVLELFGELGVTDVEVFRSAPLHYRQRAEFTIWHDREANTVVPVMYAAPLPGTKMEGGKGRVYAIPLEVPLASPGFTVASEKINAALQHILAKAGESEVLKTKLFQINLQTTLSGELMASLLYHRKLDAEWEAAAADLRDSLADATDLPRPEAAVGEASTTLRRGEAPETGAGGVSDALPRAPSIIGRSRRQRIVLGDDAVVEEFELQGRGKLRYRQVEECFSQPNGAVCRSMLEWARDAARACGGRGALVELYCGNGNFSVAMSDLFDEVLATEISRTSVRAAKWNAATNGAANVRVARMSDEQFAAAWHAGEACEHLGVQDWAQHDLRCALVDPPRAGCDPGTVRLLSEFPRVIYISCNPETLLRDARALAETHEVERMAMFDQFPYTHHSECGMCLVRR
ncbi:unnamed protein product [Pedinophyceae sp. YPF-701]|nr:unnamed protein product [Pedinophyceae sp. YPF-701]